MNYFNTIEVLVLTVHLWDISQSDIFHMRVFIIYSVLDREEP